MPEAANDNVEMVYGHLPGGFDSLFSLSDVEVISRWAGESEKHFVARVRDAMERREC